MKASQTASALALAYRRTSYRARTPLGEVRVRIGRRNRRLDRLLERYDLREWAYLTAWNPDSVACSLPRNVAAQKQLEAELAALKLVVFRGEGLGDDRRWPPESSVLVLGLSMAAAIALGRRFGQRAVVVGAWGESAILAWCDPRPD